MDDIERVRNEVVKTYPRRASLRARVFGGVVAIAVVIGVVASIPLIPLVIIAWVGLIARSPGSGWTAYRMGSAIGDAEPGELYGISGRILFPMVACGWFLIALIAGGLVGERVLVLGWIVGLGLLIVPTLIVYRAMHPVIAKVPFDEWLGSRRPGPVLAPLATWIATAWLVWSITTWTTFVGRTWTTICMFAFVLSVIVLPLLFLLVTPRGGPRLYGFVTVAIAIGLVTLVAHQADLTPDPKAWQ